MAESILFDIVCLCLSVDTAAREIYARLRARTADQELADFWGAMADDEEKHILFWQQLLESIENSRIPNIFDNPEKTRNELYKLKTDTEALLKSLDTVSGAAAAFLVAYRLEFYMTHPAFPALFHFMRKLTGDVSPEDNYDDHINKLVDMCSRQKNSQPEFSLFSDIIQAVWRSNRETAVQIAQIKTVEYLIPICTQCRKVVNIKGRWEPVEYFLQKKQDGSFTHWICPQCMKELYPEQQ